MTLYEIISAISAWEPVVDEETGEVTNISELEQLEMDKETKTENIALLYKNTMAEAMALKAEIDSFKARYDKKKKVAESLLRYLSFAVDGKKFETAKVAVKITESDRTEIDDESVIPCDLFAEKVERKPNKELIKKLLKGGETVPGCHLVKSRSATVK